MLFIYLNMANKILCEYDYLEEDSDQERGLDSSDDEIDVILHGTPKQKRRLSRSLSEGSLDVLSSGDEFEKEMEMELEESMKQHNSQQQRPTSNTNNPSTSTAATSNGERQYYDKVYFDSDEEDEQGSADGPNLSAKSKKRQLVQSNDDLFYDPKIDDDNQKWVDSQRSCYYPSHQPNSTSHPLNSVESGSTGKNGPEAKSTAAEGRKSDAILNCPACMTTLCLDCQRHELYPTQYRAMFVLNCEIVRSEKLKFKPNQKKKKGRWKKKAKGGATEGGEGSTAGTGEEEEYNPVRCSECNTEVAVLDSDEVYHFFNVLVGVA